MGGNQGKPAQALLSPKEIASSCMQFPCGWPTDNYTSVHIYHHCYCFDMFLKWGFFISLDCSGVADFYRRFRVMSLTRNKTLKWNLKHHYSKPKL